MLFIYNLIITLHLFPGPFVSALEFATGANSVVVGKPTQEFFLSSVAEFGCEPQDCVMIGDVSTSSLLVFRVFATTSTSN